MVTNTAPVVVRIPHPVQAGGLPATLWITRRLLNLALLLGLLWAIPAAAASYPEHTALWLAGILGAVLVIFVLSRVFGRIERNRIPGALRLYGMNEQPRRPWIPDAIANLTEVVVIIVALPYLIAHSDQYGGLAVMLTLLGVSLLTFGIFNAIADVWNRLPGWKREMARSLAGSLPIAITLAYAGLEAAPDPYGVAPQWLWVGLIIAVVGKFLAAVIRPFGRGINEGLDEAADAFVIHSRIAPTLHERDRMRTTFRVSAIAAAFLVIGVTALFAVA